TLLDKENIRGWQQQIGYVPQDIYLSDDNIAKNIAFGIHDNEIDMNRVKDVARMAALDSFIEKELSEGYDTIVGERGVRLSGGQKQRIGLARSLYRDPEVLVLDEATSALDYSTEKLVIQAVEKASKNRTVIMIAHRLTTLKKCDVIYEVKNGKVKVSN
ncbi:MAG: ATP-binding cassette domain-containing protein, partial [Candidatus Woesearchaeota archaeon]